MPTVALQIESDKSYLWQKNTVVWLGVFKEFPIFYQGKKLEKNLTFFFFFFFLSVLLWF